MAKKIRFQAVVDGVKREVFSMEERPSNDVLVFMRPTSWIEIRGEPKEIKQDRLTFHLSPGSSGITLKRTIETKDGMTLTSVAFIDQKDTLLHPVISAYCPDLRHANYKNKAKPTDKSIRLAHEVPIHSTLAWTLFVAKAGFDFPRSNLALVHSHNFSFFSIGIYVNFVNLPTVPFGATLTLRTSSVQIDKVLVDDMDRIEGGLPPFDPGNIDKYLVDANDELTASYAKIITNGGGETAFRKMPIPVTYSARPLTSEGVRLSVRPKGPRFGLDLP